MTNIRQFFKIIFVSYSVEHINKICITNDKCDVVLMLLLEELVEGNNENWHFLLRA